MDFQSDDWSTEMEPFIAASLLVFMFWWVGSLGIWLWPGVGMQEWHTFSIICGVLLLVVWLIPIVIGLLMLSVAVLVLPCAAMLGLFVALRKLLGWIQKAAQPRMV